VSATPPTTPTSAHLRRIIEPERHAALFDAIDSSHPAIRAQADQLALQLVQAGMLVEDLQWGLAAVAQIVTTLDGNALAAADFVAATAATAGLYGPSIKSAATLARYAQDVWPQD
jgi:hypothetical protein